MFSSDTCVRMRDASALPVMIAIADMATAAPNNAVPPSSYWSRSQNAMWKNMKPTAQRNIVIATAASCRRATLNCSRCSRSDSVDATRSAASCEAKKSPAPKSSAL